MPQSRVIILTAVQFEAKHIARCLGLVRESNRSWTGQSAGGLQASLFVVGVRAVALPNLTPRSAQYIVIAGLAGALDPSLKIGDVLIEEDDQSAPKIFHCASSIVATPEQKSALFRETGARAVEMEGNTIRRWVDDLAIPVVTIRSISDTAQEHLDPATLRLIDEFGRIRPLELVLALLRQPARFRSLRRLGKNSSIAADSLAAAVAGWISSANATLPAQ